MRRTPRETALLVALLLKRSEKTRGRISTATIRRLSKRKHIRQPFIELFDKYLGDLGVALIDIERGGFAIVASSALNGAPPLTARRYLLNDLRRIRQGEIDFDRIQAELEDDIDGEADNDT
jgi:hypothetical protein